MRFHAWSKLDLEECRRFWLTPDETLDVARLWTHDQHHSIRKFFSNAVARGFIAGRQSGQSRTSPRLFSLESALKTAVMCRLTRQGRPFEIASEVGEAAIAVLRDRVIRDEYWSDVDGPDTQHVVVYFTDLAGKIRTEIQSTVTLKVHDLYLSAHGCDVGVCMLSPLLYAILESYSLKWRDERDATKAKRG